MALNNNDASGSNTNFRFPSSSSPAPAQAGPTPLSSSPPKSSRIHFPNTNSSVRNSNNNNSSTTTPVSEGPPSAAVLGIRSRRAISYGLPSRGYATGTDLNRVPQGRIRSVDMNGSSKSPNKRMIAKSLLGAAPIVAERVNEEDGSHSLRAFSDEYDLAHDDPRILQDVERALKLKAKRDARIKSGVPASIPKNRGDISQQGGQSAEPSSPRRVLSHRTSVLALSSDTTNSALDNKAEVDFSPAVVTTMPLHPIPLSSDGGTTLDWGSTSEDDSKHTHGSPMKWVLAASKRKGKEKEVEYDPKHLASLDSQYTERLRRINTLATPQTHSKAAITADQLSRRYNRLSDSLNPGFEKINLAAIARWYGSQDDILRRTLEKAEPFTWLKHLDRRKPKSYLRPHWHLSALTVEEHYVALATVRKSKQLMEEFGPPRIHSLGETTLSTPVASPPLSSDIASEDRKPSFEPHVETPPPLSLVDASPRKSADNGSIYSGSLLSAPSITSVQYSPQTSPAKPHSRRNSRGELIPALRRQRRDSSDAGSSVRGEFSGSDDAGLNGHGHPPKISKQIRIDIPEESGSPARKSNSAGIRIIVSRENSEAELSSPVQLRAEKSIVNNKMKRRLVSRNSSSTGKSLMIADPASGTESSVLSKLARRSRQRMSLPAADIPPTLTEEQLKQQEIDEGRKEEEYKLKLSLLNDCVSQNNGMRVLLRSIGETLRDYNLAQARILRSHGLKFPRLPAEVIEAIRHDPAGIVAMMKNDTSWRTVDYVQDRLLKQRDVLESYVRENYGSSTSTFSLPDSTFEEPVQKLLEYFALLEQKKDLIVQRAKSLAPEVEEVKELHAAVKKEYNETLAHTSIIYPELSLLVGLEESHHAQYQHFWDLGMDALTLILDTVTPFWRTYGKTIGKDVRDFLIIPLYRNEFTGEAKRYPLTHFPRRSFRHWFCLLFLSACCIAMTGMQIYAAWISTVNSRLGWIEHPGVRWMILPFFWVGILVQWGAVLLEVFIVFCQVGMALWWMGWLVDICR